jgi:hypothetical protein
MYGVECLESFLRDLIDPSFLLNVLLEAEETTSNLVLLHFDFRCVRGLVKEVLVAILYTPKIVVRVTAEVVLKPEVGARDFILRVYPSLISMGYGVDVSSEGIRVYRVYSCRGSPDRSFTRTVSEILSVFNESCEVIFRGSYSLESLTPP